jgi:hypothetical protein
VAADHPERAEAVRQRVELVEPAQAVLGVDCALLGLALQRGDCGGAVEAVG